MEFAKRRRTDGVVAVEPTDTAEVKQLIDMFTNEWTKQVWFNNLMMRDVSDQTVGAIEKAVLGSGSADVKSLRILEQIESFKKIKDSSNVETYAKRQNLPKPCFLRP